MRAQHDSMRRRLLLGAAGLIAGAALSRRAAGAAPASGNRAIEIGLMPYMPTARLLAAHQSLRHYIEAEFKRPAVLSTAANFHIFQRRVLRGDFDLILTGPNIGWQAHLDGAMEPIAVSKKFVVIQIVVANDGRIASIADLRGKTLATIDPITTTAQTTVQMLREEGLVAGKDVQIRHENSPYNCAQAVLLGEVAAAGFPNVSFQALTADMRGKLRSIKDSLPLPGVMFSSRRGKGIPSPQQFQAALFRFAEDTPEGRAYINDLGHEGLLRPDFKHIHALDSLVPEVRRSMANP